MAKEKYGEDTNFDFFESGSGGEIFKYIDGKKKVIFSFIGDLDEVYEHLGNYE
jgi:hypothetical protein